MLSGEPPFSGSATQILVQVLQRDPLAPSRRRAGVDPYLEAVCLKCLEKEQELP